MVATILASDRCKQTREVIKKLRMCSTGWLVDLPIRLAGTVGRNATLHIVIVCEMQ
jgi:hypothetical protein